MTLLLVKDPKLLSEFLLLLGTYVQWDEVVVNF